MRCARPASAYYAIGGRHLHRVFRRHDTRIDPDLRTRQRRALENARRQPTRPRLPITPLTGIPGAIAAPVGNRYTCQETGDSTPGGGYASPDRLRAAAAHGIGSRGTAVAGSSSFLRRLGAVFNHAPNRALRVAPSAAPRPTRHTLLHLACVFSCNVGCYQVDAVMELEA
jgi:hypothetical protein